MAGSKFSRLVEIAKALKLTKQTGRSFHCAFVLRKRKTIAIGFNNFKKSNRVCHKYKPTRYHEANYSACIHAEIDATSALRDRGGAGLTLVSIRIDNHNRLAFAMPCPNCLLHLGRMGFRSITYSDHQGNFQSI